MTLPPTPGHRRPISGGRREIRAVGFSIGSKGYIGTGWYYDGSTQYFNKDFWEYDPTANTWTQKADFGGIGRVMAVGFSIGSKGYIGTGWDVSPSPSDFWEYDPTANTWTQKADFGGTARDRAVGFSIGTKGYIGTGYNEDSDSDIKDFWEYNPGPSPLYGDFGSGGLWVWNGIAWSQVNAVSPNHMVASGLIFYGDFGSGGLWQWDGTAWSEVNTVSPTSMETSDSILYGNFGAGGCWVWNGIAWTQVNAVSPNNMVTSP